MRYLIITSAIVLSLAGCSVGRAQPINRGALVPIYLASQQEVQLASDQQAERSGIAKTRGVVGCVVQPADGHLQIWIASPDTTERRELVRVLSHELLYHLCADKTGAQALMALDPGDGSYLHH